MRYDMKTEKEIKRLIENLIEVSKPYDLASSYYKRERPAELQIHEDRIEKAKKELLEAIECLNVK
jgi:hypothetical protein